MISKTRHHKKHPPKWLVVLFISLVTLTLFVGFYSAFKERMDEHGCLDSYDNERHTVVLIDGTDAYTARQNNALGVKIDDIVDNLAYQERLSIFVIEGDVFSNGANVASSIPRPLSFFCKPKDGKEVNGLVEGADNIKRVYKEFKAKQRDLIEERLLKLKPSKDSPILEYLREITRNYKPFDHNVKERRLIIFSDLVQHTPPDFDSCSDNYPYKFGEFKKSANYDDIKSDLTNTHVSTFLIQRRGAASSECAARVQSNKLHINFWRDVFKDAGAIIDQPGFTSIRE